MRFFITSLFLLISFLSLAQPGFNQKYDLGEVGASFGSFVLHGDTIIAYGGCLQPGKKAFGLLFAKIDTNGNVLSYRVYNDSLGDDFTQVYPQSFIKLNDGTGYVGVGQMFKRRHGYFVKYNNQGDVILYKEFPDSLSQVDFYLQIMEVNGGFLLAGNKQKWDFLSEVFVMKVNIFGEKVWEKKMKILREKLALVI